MVKINIAYVTLYDATYSFCQFSQKLKKITNSFFVISRKKDLDTLSLFDIDKENILDLSLTRNQFRRLPIDNKNNSVLKKYENKNLPYQSIYKASRFFYNEDKLHIEAYAADILTRIDEFFTQKNIDYCYTEASDLVQLLSQLVCWKKNIKFRSIALARIPSNRVLLFNNCFDESIVPLHEKSHRKEKNILFWLDSYKLNLDRPAYFNKIIIQRSFSSLIKSLLNRLILFIKELIGVNDINQLNTLYLIKFYLKNKLRFYSPYYNTLALRKINTSHQYVVYYLHVQPERSIDVISPFFQDQFLIIHKIRRALPNSVKLYVKDHPAYDGAQSMTFYKNIFAMNGVELLHHSLDSRKIANDALAVATVSGTIGLEMALQNKPVLIFSNIFFSSLPQVKIYTNFKDLQSYFKKLVNYKMSKSTLNHTVNYLDNIFSNSVKTSWDGHFGRLNQSHLSSITKLIAADLQNAK